MHLVVIVILITILLIWGLKDGVKARKKHKRENWWLNEKAAGKFLLFAWVTPEGGTRDLQSHHGTIDSAMEAGHDKDVTYLIVEHRSMTVIKRKMSKTDSKEYEDRSWMDV